ncbi:MAG: hypothetical protein LBJ67_04780 [Planctomycetaceae bacterium]|jgi:hypothetical protein|nr:hypothetical protein [Planctomycetaceae bacterium]
MFQYLVRFFLIVLLTLLIMTAGCKGGFRVFSSNDASYKKNAREFKKMVENDPFPPADAIK